MILYYEQDLRQNNLIWRKPKIYDSLSLLREKERDLIVTGYKTEVFGLGI